MANIACSVQGHAQRKDCGHKPMAKKTMQPSILDERGVRFWGYAPGKVSAEMPLFYNPAMRINRDIGVGGIKGTASHFSVRGTGQVIRLVEPIHVGHGLHLFQTFVRFFVDDPVAFGKCCAIFRRVIADEPVHERNFGITIIENLLRRRVFGKQNRRAACERLNIGFVIGDICRDLVRERPLAAVGPERLANSFLYVWFLNHRLTGR